MTRDEDGLELPNGDVVGPGDVILFEGYPYRVELDDAVLLSPVYWGDSPLDLVFDETEEIAGTWDDESRGTLTEAEWEVWLADARADERFGKAEVDAIADEVLPSRSGRRATGVLGRLRELLGLE